jgi:ABC-type lipoprotein release transport system permease subunit
VPKPSARLSLGARRQDVLGTIFSQGLALVVTPSSVHVFGLVIGALLITATLAMLLPALRASCVDPLQVIRQP